MGRFAIAITLGLAATAAFAEDPESTKVPSISAADQPERRWIAPFGGADCPELGVVAGPQDSRRWHSACDDLRSSASNETRETQWGKQ